MGFIADCPTQHPPPPAAPGPRHDQLLSLYLALFACLMDRQDYQAGLDQLHQALIQLPRTHHKVWRGGSRHTAAV